MRLSKSKLNVWDTAIPKLWKLHSGDVWMVLWRSIYLKLCSILPTEYEIKKAL
jgi:hypothetical protein